MPVSFSKSQFSNSNILVIGPQYTGKTTLISRIKDVDAVVLEDVDGVSNNVCIDAVNKAGYRQVIMSLKECKCDNAQVLPFDHIVVFNNKHMGWRDDIYYNYSLQRVFEDFDEFAQALDRLDAYECLVISSSDGTARRFKCD
jgi:hypothetical protein